MHPVVTQRIVDRSRDSRARYLQMIDRAAQEGPCSVKLRQLGAWICRLWKKPTKIA